MVLVTKADINKVSPKSGDRTNDVEADYDAGYVLGDLGHVPSLASTIPSLATTAHSRQLSDQLADPSLIRGVDVGTVLQYFGRAFSSTTGGIVASQDDYMLSAITTHLDDFISHDWSSGRWKKTILLLWTYNGTAALGVSMIFSMALAFLQMDFVNVLPKPRPLHVKIAGEDLLLTCGIWCTTLAPLMFFATLLFWRRFCSALGVISPLLFVDKFCIDQVDEDRKTAAILGLAGFLRRSQRLVVCWTPRYFTRLWTIYEIASWFHLGKSTSSILFQPASHPVLVLSIIVVLSLYFSVRVMLRSAVVADLDESWLLGVLIVLAIGLFVITAQRRVRELGQLPRQLEEFSITRANCFCCAHSHVMPSTGKHMPCDRDLVYKTLTLWFASKNEDSEDSVDISMQDAALECFDNYVRTDFAAKVLTCVGRSGMPYRQLLVAMAPLWWYICDMLPAVASVRHDLFIRYLTGYFSYGALSLPAGVGLIFNFLFLLDQCIGSDRRSILDLAVTFWGFLFSLATLLVVWLPISWLNSYVQDYWPLIIYESFLVLLTYGLFGKPRLS